MCDEGAEREAHYSKLVWLAKRSGKLSRLYEFCELDEDSLMFAELICEAGDSGRTLACASEDGVLDLLLGLARS